MRNTFSTPEAFSAFENLLSSTSHEKSKDKGLSRTWQALVEPDDENGDSFSQRYLLTENPVEPWTFQEIQDLTSAMDTPGCRDNIQVASQGFVGVHIKFSFHIYRSSTKIKHLASTLHSTIVETFLDCAPSVFSPSSTPSETEVDLVVTVALIVRTLYHVVLQSSVCEDFSYPYLKTYLGFRSTVSTWII
jgi:pre-rRNA-processing protein IPI1